MSVPPLLNDPLPVVNHFLGQSEDPAECAEGDIYAFVFVNEDVLLEIYSFQPIAALGGH